MPYPLPKEWSEQGIREFLQFRNAEDKHFECKAFLHFDWELKCDAEQSSLKDLAEKPFHSTNPAKSYLSLRAIESILAFVNADGGVLFLGVAESRSDLPPIESIPIISLSGDTKFTVTGIERDGIGILNGVFDEDVYKRKLQDLLFPQSEKQHEYTKKRIENRQVATIKRLIKYPHEYQKDLVKDIHVVPFHMEHDQLKNIAVLIIRRSPVPVVIEEFFEGKPSDPVPKLYKRLAFNNNGPILGADLMSYLQHPSPPTEPHVQTAKVNANPIPPQFREALNNYVVPVIEGKDISESIEEAIDKGEHIFIIGESGMGKSLLLAHCYLKLCKTSPSCYYSIDRTQGPAVYESAPVLCSIRQQIESMDGMPKIEAPTRYESKTLWVWEKEYLDTLLKAWTEANPYKRLTIFLDGLDENYILTRETEFILNILESLVKQKNLNISWVFSSQPRKGMGWIQNCFKIIKLEGLGREEASRLLQNVMGGKHKSLHAEILKRSDMGENQYDPEMLVMLSRAITESKIAPFRSPSSRQVFFQKLPLDFRQKYTWLFSRYTDPAKMHDIPSLKDNARRWEKLVPSIPYTRFLSDVLSVLVVTRRPIPVDVLRQALELEEIKQQVYPPYKTKQAFRHYPREAIEEWNFLHTALEDLRRFVKVVEETDGACSFCKDAVRESFISFASDELIESARARLFQLALEELSLIKPQNLHQMSDYLLMELLYLLALRCGESSKGRDLLFFSNLFPEWLKIRAERYQREQWVPGFLHDMALFDDMDDSQSLKERERIVKKVLQEWGRHLDAYPQCTAALLRNANLSQGIWPAITEQGELMIPHGGYIRRLKGHYGNILCLAALPDGRLASGGLDGKIRIWDLNTDKCQILDADTEPVTDLAVLPDGRLVSGGWLSPLIIWNVETGERKYLSFGVTDLLVQPDGRIVAVDMLGSIEVWDVDTETSQELKCEEGYFASLAILSKDRIAVGYGSKGILIWDLKTDSVRQMAKIEGPKYVGAILQILSDSCLAFVTSDGTIQIWDIDSGHFSVLMDKIDARSILVLPNQQIVAGDSKGYVHVWSLGTGKHKRWKGHKKSVEKLTVLPDGRFVSSTSDGMISIWDAETGKRKSLDGGENDLPSGPPQPLLPLPNGQIASADNNFSVRVWNIETGECKVFKGWNEGAICFLILPDGRLATGHKDQRIRIWDAERNISKTLEGAISQIFCMAFLPDGRILSGGANGNITIWDIHSNEHEVLTPGNGKYIEDLKIVGTTRAISYGSEGIICIWDIYNRTCQYIKKAKSQPRSARVRFTFGVPSTGGQQLTILDRERIALLDGKSIRIWNIETGECKILKGHEEDVSVLKALPDGLLASGSADGTIRIWDDRLRKSIVLKGHEENVISLDLLPDNRLVSGGKDGIIRIWDLNTTESHILKGSSSPIDHLTVLPDGHIISGSREQLSVRVWNPADADKVQDIVTRMTLNKNDDVNMKEKIGFLEAPPTFLTYWKSRNCLVVGTEAGIEFFRV
jgi:WD40 repeat protein